MNLAFATPLPRNAGLRSKLDMLRLRRNASIVKFAIFLSAMPNGATAAALAVMIGRSLLITTIASKELASSLRNAFPLPRQVVSKHFMVLNNSRLDFCGKSCAFQIRLGPSATLFSTRETADLILATCNPTPGRETTVILCRLFNWSQLSVLTSDQNGVPPGRFATATRCNGSHPLAGCASDSRASLLTDNSLPY